MDMHLQALVNSRDIYTSTCRHRFSLIRHDPYHNGGLSIARLSETDKIPPVVKYRATDEEMQWTGGLCDQLHNDNHSAILFTFNQILSSMVGKLSKYVYKPDGALDGRLVYLYNLKPVFVSRTFNV